MASFNNRYSNGLLTSLLALILCINILSSIAVSQLVVVTDPIKYPLPSLPALCTLNGLFKVVIKAPASAANWRFSIFSDLANYNITYSNSFYNSTSGLWTFYLNVPPNTVLGLYSLKISYSSDGVTYVYTQSKSVYVFKDYPKYLLIAHLSDLHLPYGADVIARAIYELNLIRPDIIIITGDFVDIGTIASAWRYAWSIIFNGSSKIPILVLPGNHDHSGDDAANYQKYCGPIYWNLSFGKFNFIAMDTRESGYVDDLQLKWAEEVLKTININDVKILLIHHPIFGTGFQVTGSWQNINALRSHLYYSWDSNLNAASNFLRLVEQYDVDLVLAGHIHREQFNIYNNKYIFETMAPAGGSLPAGVYWSYRLINVSDAGVINVLSRGGKAPQDSPSAYPIGVLSYYYTPRNDGSSNASSIKVYNGLDAGISPLIEFIVNGSIPFNNYKFYPSTPSNYSVINLGDKYLVQFRANIPASSGYHITLTSFEDKILPSIHANVIKSGSELLFNINATDVGVGVKRVGLMYKFTFSDGSKSDWYILSDITPKLIVNKDSIYYSYDKLSYEYKLALPSNVLNVTYSIIAEDFMGNSRYLNETFIVEVPKYYNLIIDSSPISGIQFTLGTSTYNTKFSTTLKSGNYTISFPREAVVGGVKYIFDKWSDGFSGTSRTISLKSDITLTVYYVAEAPPQAFPTWMYMVVIGLAIAIIVVVVLRRR
ncbi:MAG: metallophosphoesterase [Candidatus Methanomethylicia archaeon]